jgi:hypothetical protein
VAHARSISISSDSSDKVLEKTRIREVTGVFYSRKAIDAAVQDLLLSGTDRADIDVSAPPEEWPPRLKHMSIPPAELADLPHAPRRPLVTTDDMIVTEIVISSLIGCAGGLAIAYYLSTKDMPTIAVIMMSFAVGLALAALAMMPVHRAFKRESMRGLDKLSEGDGLLIWVRVRSPATEAAANKILLRHGANFVHIHEFEEKKTIEDLPLGELRPDPWLGDERLGQP